MVFLNESKKTLRNEGAPLVKSAGDRTLPAISKKDVGFLS